MQDEARITIAGLSKNLAEALMPNIREIVPAKCVSINLQILPPPRPERVFENEYNIVQGALDRMCNYFDNMFDFREPRSLKEADKSIKIMEKDLTKLYDLVGKLETAVTKLEIRYNKEVNITKKKKKEKK